MPATSVAQLEKLLWPDGFSRDAWMVVDAASDKQIYGLLLSSFYSTHWNLFSGDAAHFKDNWDNRRVPGMNVDAGKTMASMQHIADLLEQYHAQPWINHDAPQTAQTRHAPEYYE